MRKTIILAAAISALSLLCPRLTSAQVTLHLTNCPDSTSQAGLAAMLKIYPPDINAYALVAGMGRLGNVGKPQEDDDAATKSYTDSLFLILSSAVNSLQQELNSGLDTTICVNDGGGSHWFQYTKGRLSAYEKRPHHCDWY